MKTFNEIRAFELIKRISKEIENEHNALIDLMRKAENFEMPACKARKEYARIISAAAIDCNRIYNIANKYFNGCGRVPSTVDNINIYRIDSFSYIIRFFEL